MPNPDPHHRVQGFSSALTPPSSVFPTPRLRFYPPPSVLRPPPFFPALRPPPSALLPGLFSASAYTRVRMLEKRVNVSLCLTLSHAKNASQPGKRAPQVVPWS